MHFHYIEAGYLFNVPFDFAANECIEYADGCIVQNEKNFCSDKECRAERFVNSTLISVFSVAKALCAE